MDLRMVGFRIREIRTNKNLTQEELAELADISVTHISALERGVKNANLSTFVAIANALQVSADTLLIDVIPYSISGVTNELLHEFSQYIVGRMGIPYRQRGISIISVVVDAHQNVISSLSGKLGMIDGISVKVTVSKTP